MSIKKLFLIGVLGLSFCMTGCGNGQKVDSEKEFSTNDISEIVINNSSWNLKILASSDDKIHVSYDGKIEDGVSNIQILQNESQLVIQQDTTSSKNIATQFSFGKAGKITLYIPKNTVLPYVLYTLCQRRNEPESITVHHGSFKHQHDIELLRPCYIRFRKIGNGKADCISSKRNVLLHFYYF